jgi:glutathione S-transferase
MQVPFELVGIDHPKHELDTEAYRAMNPFAQIPVLDDDGVIVTESAAIAIYLAKKSGKLIPKDLAGEAQVLRWAFAAMNSVELPLLTLQFAGWIDKSGERPARSSAEGGAEVDDKSEASPVKKALAGWSEMRLASLERWLTGREWIAIDEFTVADILMTHVIGIDAHAAMVAKYEHVKAYVDRCKARPAWHRVIESYCERVEAA